MSFFHCVLMQIESYCTFFLEMNMILDSALWICTSYQNHFLNWILKLLLEHWLNCAFLSIKMHQMLGLIFSPLAVCVRTAFVMNMNHDKCFRPYWKTQRKHTLLGRRLCHKTEQVNTCRPFDLLKCASVFSSSNICVNIILQPCSTNVCISIRYLCYDIICFS